MGSHYIIQYDNIIDKRRNNLSREWIALFCYVCIKYESVLSLHGCMILIEIMRQPFIMGKPGGIWPDWSITSWAGVQSMINLGCHSNLDCFPFESVWLKYCFVPFLEIKDRTGMSLFLLNITSRTTHYINAPTHRLCLKPCQFMICCHSTINCTGRTTHSLQKPHYHWVTGSISWDFDIRPFKINCAFWVTSLLPFPVSNWKTHAIYSMEKCYFSVYDDVNVLLFLNNIYGFPKRNFVKYENSCISFLKCLCVFSLCVFFASLAPSFWKKSWLKTHNLFWMA